MYFLILSSVVLPHIVLRIVYSPCVFSYFPLWCLLSMCFLVLTSVVITLHVFPFIVLYFACPPCVSLYCPQCSACTPCASLYYAQCYACSPCVSSYCPQVKISGRNSQGYSQFSRPVSYTTPARGQLAISQHIFFSPPIFSSCEQCDGCHGCQFSCQFGDKASPSLAVFLQRTGNIHVNCEAGLSFMSLK